MGALDLSQRKLRQVRWKNLIKLLCRKNPQFGDSQILRGSMQVGDVLTDAGGMIYRRWGTFLLVKNLL